MFALQPLPRDAANARHGVAHFVEHVGHMVVVPVEAEFCCDLLDDPQVLSRVTRRVNRLTAYLHQAIGVGEAAGFLGEGAGGQDHVGQIRRFGQEDVLHHEVIERG